MKSMELFFNDLTPAAQEKYLKVQGVSSASELNWEVSPIAIIEVEDEDGVCKKCGTPLDEKGLCKDITCPYSNRQQSATYTEE
jgi:hypothetical protein